jgi:pimeloyl-ACP methyl ester carboxylesterase
MRHHVTRWIITIAAAVWPCLSPAATGEPADVAVEVDVRPAQVTVGGTVYDAIWYLPLQGEPAGFAVLEHGFARRCDNMVQTTLRVAQTSLVVLCITAPLAGGNAALAQALAAHIADGTLRLPDGGALPSKVFAAGFSAGGVFAARLAQALAASAPQRLRGLLMLDPVAASGLGQAIADVSATGTRPVLAITTNPSSCNAFNSVHPDLRQLSTDLDAAGQDAFVGLQLTRASSHVDFEGEDTDALASAVCGRPRADNVEVARTLAAAWAFDIVAGTRTSAYYPGGNYVERLFTRQRAALIAAP